jgi:N-methylhydantoinase A
MGGTSTDVALCRGEAPLTTEGEIAGLPLRLPLIDIHTVGAGGGSLAYLDAGGALQVGPESAGAWPGPACYWADYEAWRAARGDSRRPTADGRPPTAARRETDHRQLTTDQRRRTNDQRPTTNDRDPSSVVLRLSSATVTDANLVLGRLDAGHFLGGAMWLHESSARAALAALAGPMGMTAEAAALAVVRVANAAMERAIRRISVERGHDPRRFTLVAFGCGGPLHACELAESLGIPRVLVPPAPGVLSALGMIAAAPARDYSRTVMLPAAEAGPSRLAAGFAPLEALAQERLGAEHGAGRIELRRALDMRYTGQSHELTVPYAMDGTIAGAFHAAHAARYGYARPVAPVEIVTLRLTAVAPVTPPPLPRREPGGPDPSAARVGRRPVWFAGGPLDTALYDRAGLRPGNFLAGPSVLYQYDTTTVIPPGWAAVVDVHENLILARTKRQ